MPLISPVCFVRRLSPPQILVDNDEFRPASSSRSRRSRSPPESVSFHPRHIRILYLPENYWYVGFTLSCLRYQILTKIANVFRIRAGHYHLQLYILSGFFALGLLGALLALWIRWSRLAFCRSLWRFVTGRDS